MSALRKPVYPAPAFTCAEGAATRSTVAGIEVSGIEIASAASPARALQQRVEAAALQNFFATATDQKTHLDVTQAGRWALVAAITVACWVAIFALALVLH